MTGDGSGPLVSVITPSYNRGWIIQKCLDSVKGQTYRNIEHIVVDACSGDETIRILKENEGDYSLRWISERDEGMYDAINKGIRMAKGEIIAYLNTDDFYFPNTVELIVQRFQAEQDTSLVYGDWVTFHTDGSFLELLPCLRVDKYDMAVFACLPQPAVFMRREVFDRVGFFDTTYKLIADNEFFTRIAMNDLKLAKLDEFLAGQVVHEENLLAGNLAANGTVDAEARRYREASRAALSARATAADRLGLSYAMLRSRLHAVIWRVRLVELWVRRLLRLRGKWSNGLDLLSGSTVRFSDFVGYLVSRKRYARYKYCVCADFMRGVGR